MIEFTHERMLLLNYVIEKHGDQKRKYTFDPYWFHLMRVAQMAHVAGVRFGFEIGLCHDLIEDTDVEDGRELRQALIACGYSGVDATFIARMVEDLTDVFTKENYPKLNRKERKKREAERLWNIDPVAQSVKYCDLMDNGESIRTYDLGFAKVYIAEKEYILAGMADGDPELFHKVKTLIEYETSK